MDHCRNKTQQLIMQSAAQAAIEEIASQLEGARTISRGELDAILQKHGRDPSTASTVVGVIPL